MFAVGSPSGSIDKPFRALLFDSWYDQYVGVVCMLGVVDGKIRKGDKITSAHSNAKYEVSEVSIIWIVTIYNYAKLMHAIGWHYASRTSSNRLSVWLAWQYSLSRLLLTIIMDRHAGQVGYVICGMKTASEAHVGDTFYHVGQHVEALPGFQPAQSMVFAGIFPVDTNDFKRLDESITKLTLNDASVSVHKETR